ncbi:hypothetical protein OKW45_001995 [Paraburkholderia sp. WSM4175]|uniref:hypothetical protein n=1 Tax=Paraburkholderia sp. WSM4175 TaxID=2991072 RepID=UPI003D247350
MEHSTSIAVAWQSFAADMIPLDAPGSQYSDMRMAFYAGAIHCIDILTAPVDGRIDAPTVNRLHEERRTFLREIKQRQQMQRGTP